MPCSGISHRCGCSTRRCGCSTPYTLIYVGHRCIYSAPCCRYDQARSRLMRRPCRAVVPYAMSGNAQEGRSCLPFVLDLADCLACLRRRLGPDWTNGATARCEPSRRSRHTWPRNMSAFIYPRCYYTSIDIPPALHLPRRSWRFPFAEQILPREFGGPMKIRIPIKIGFKNSEAAVALSVANVYPSGFWEDNGHNRFSGS